LSRFDRAFRSYPSSFSRAGKLAMRARAVRSAVEAGSSAQAASTCSTARRRAPALAARTLLNSAWAMAAARACLVGVDWLLQNLSAHASMIASCG
jgi:hypothetical protein